MNGYTTVADPPIVATVAHPDTPDVVYDGCWNWESGQTYANQGYIVTAVANDGDYWPIERLQAMFDHERALFLDCWDRTTPFE